MVYWNFRKAREYIIKRNIKNKLDWIKYSQSDGFPDKNIPINPEEYYKKKGWVTFDHWIGNKLLSFKEFKQIINKNNIYKKSQYIEFYNKNIKDFLDRKLLLPANPDKSYNKNNWKGWEKLSNYFMYLDLVIINNNTHIKIEYKKYNSKINIKKFKFKKLKEYAQSKKLSNQREWFAHFKELIKDNVEDLEFQIQDDKFYTNDPSITSSFDEFDASSLEYNRFVILKNEGYANPARTFKNYGWINWRDFLGTNNINRKEKKWCNFKEAKNYVVRLGLQNRTEWEIYYKKNKGRFINNDKIILIPLRPDRIKFYDNDWISWKDFLVLE